MDSISAVPLLPSASTQVSFAALAPVVASCTGAPLMDAASHFPASTTPGLGHPLSSTLLPSPSPSPLTSTQANLSLSLSMEPIPAKLVHRIQSGQFVKMRDLLGDNIALIHHFESANSYFPAHVLSVSFHLRLRKVSSLSSWIYCFLAYLVVGTSDQSTCNWLISARLVVREALQHEGRGWLDYDRFFRQQAALNPALAWNTLHPSLVASTILSQRSVGGSYRNLCQGVDHLASCCAMAYLQDRDPAKRDAVVGPGRPSQVLE